MGWKIVVNVFRHGNGESLIAVTNANVYVKDGITLTHAGDGLYVSSTWEYEWQVDTGNGYPCRVEAEHETYGSGYIENVYAIDEGGEHSEPYTIILESDTVDPTLTFTPVSGTLTYNGSTQTIGTISYDGDGQAYYMVKTNSSVPSPSASGWVAVSDNTQISSSAAGVATYYVFLKSTEGTNYNAVNPKSGGNKAISKAAGNVGTAVNPAAKALNESNTNNYTFTLSMSGNTGTVTYPSSITVTKNGSTVTGWTISGSTVSCSHLIGAGSYVVTGTVTCAASTNYNAVTTGQSRSWTCTINQASDASVTPTINSSTLTYSASSTNRLISSTTAHGTSSYQLGYKLGSAATADSQITWGTANTATLDLPAGASAGTYYLYKKWTADSNHSNSQTYVAIGSTYTKVVGKATGYLNPTTTNKTYTGSEQVIASMPSGGASGAYYFGLGSSTTVAPTSWGSQNQSLKATTAGTYYVWAKCNTSTNYLAVDAKYIATVTISKRTGAAPTFSPSNLSVTLAPTNATTSPAVNCSAFTAAAAGHGGTITGYAIQSVKNGSTAVSGWTLNSSTRVITVPASTVGGIGYTVVLRATEGETATDTSSYKDATITVTVNKKAQTAPTATGNTTTYATSGSISGSASGGGGVGTITYKSDANGGTNYGTATTTAPSRNRNSVGTTTFIAYWPGNNYWAQSSNSNQASLVISKADSGLKFNPKSATVTYNGSGATAGSTQIIGTISWTGDITSVQYCVVKGTSQPSVPSSGWQSISTSGTSIYSSEGGAGIYWVFVKASAGTNYAAVTAKYSNNKEIVKKTPSVPTRNSATDKQWTGSTFYASAGNNTSNPAGTVYYGVSAGATTYSISVAAATNTKTNMTSMGRSALGTTTIYLFFRPTDTDNWNDSATTQTAIVSIIQHTATVTGKSSSKPYDGTALTLASATVANKATLSGQVSGHTLTAVTASGTITYVGSVDNTVSAATIKNGSTDVTSNYNITYVAGTLTITQATPSITVTGVNSAYTGSDQYAKLTASNVKGTIYWKKGSAPGTTSGTYDGSATISSTGTLSINLGSVKNVSDSGTLYWLVVPSSTANSLASGHTYAENYTNASGSVAVTITKATGGVTISKVSRAYKSGLALATVSNNTGTMHYKLDSGSWGTSIPTAASGVNAGDHTLYYYVDASDNYNAFGSSSSPKSLTVTVTKVTPVISTNPTKVSNWTYDKTAHNLLSGGAYKHSSSDSTAVAGTFAYAQATNAGSYTSLTWTFTPTDTTNYNTATGSITGTVTVSPKTVTLQWGVLTWPYDGFTHSTTCGLVAGGVISGDTCTISLSGNSVGPNVGTATVTASLSNSNYTISSSPSKSQTLTINQATPTLTFTYNPSATTTYSAAGPKVLITASVAGTVYWGTTSASSGMTNTKAVSAGIATQLTQNTTPGTTIKVYAYFVPTDTTNYKNVGSSTSAGATSSNVTYNKGTGGVTISNANPTYGTSNNLATVSGATGTMYYRVGTSGSFSATMPTASGRNAGSYTLYYYVAESTNYTAFGTSSSPKSLTVTVAKASNQITVSPTSVTVYYRTGYTTATITVSNYKGTVTAESSNTGKITVSPASSTSGTFTVTGVAAGSATITFTDTSTNYATSTATCSVTCAQDSVSSVDVSVGTKSLSYGGTTSITATAHYASGYSSNVTSSATYTSSPTNKVEVKPGATVTGIYIDDLPPYDYIHDESGGEGIRTFTTYLGLDEENYYTYVGTITYGGQTRYLWQNSNAAMMSYKAYIVTASNDPATLIAQSVQYNMNNWYTNSIIAILKSDQSTVYNTPTASEGKRITMVVMS